MADNSYLFTSESVTEGHPDKVADRVSDSILDAYLKEDNESLVACETMVTTDRLMLAGEVHSKAKIDSQIEGIVRGVIADIGYTHESLGFCDRTFEFSNFLHSQSGDIRQGVERGSDIGAGDQGLMFGYACRETSSYMPLAIDLSHRLSLALTEARKTQKVNWLRPDGKTQVTVAYDADDKAVKIDTVVMSTQHSEEVSLDDLKGFLREQVILPTLPNDLVDNSLKLHINPTGRFVVGGPHGDCGLTGRKIIVDTYGGYAPHGGGAFSGKDPTKVDRSAAYATRYIAKNVVASGIADKFQIQLAYAIGVAEPVSIHFEDFGTLKVDRSKVKDMIKELFPLKPLDIINKLGLRAPIYFATSAYGHFGRDHSFPWEKINLADDVKAYFS